MQKRAFNLILDPLPLPARSPPSRRPMDRRDKLAKLTSRGKPDVPAG